MGVSSTATYFILIIVSSFATVDRAEIENGAYISSIHIIETEISQYRSTFLKYTVVPTDFKNLSFLKYKKTASIYFSGVDVFFYVGYQFRM